MKPFLTNRILLMALTTLITVCASAAPILDNYFVVVVDNYFVMMVDNYIVVVVDNYFVVVVDNYFVVLDSNLDYLV